MTELLTKVVAPFAVDAVDDAARTFKGHAAAFNLDLGDDVIHPGAFTETLADWKTSGRSMPLLNSHNYFDIMSGVGQMLDAGEDDVGLMSEWEVIDGPDGDAVLARIRPSKRTGRAVIGAMSIGFMPTQMDFTESDKARSGQIRNLRKIRLEEVSLVIFPMNTSALIDVATVKMQMAHATAEQRAEFKHFHDALGTVLVPEEPASDDKSGDSPDTSLLGALQLRRLRSRSSALRAGINTHS